ncbi:MAG: S9 family peptidase [Balneolaceae bacterium]
MHRKIWYLIPLFLLLFSMMPIQAQQNHFSYMDIFDLQIAGSPEISPDGTTIVYLRHQFDVMKDRRYTNLWQISFNGEDHQPITSGLNSIGNLAWSPDSKRLAYTSSEEGSNQIFVRWMDTGAEASVTNVTKSPSSLSWSPNGIWIAFTMRVPAEKPVIAKIPSPPDGAEWAAPAKVIDRVRYRADGTGFLDPGHTHIFLVSAEGGAARQLTSGEYDHTSYSWAPDSKSIVLSANRSDNPDLDPINSHLFELDIESGELSKLTDGRGPHNNPRVSPDGRIIAYTGFEDQFVGYQRTGLFLINRDGSNKREISSDFDYDIGSVHWADDNRSLFFQYTDKGIEKVGNIRLNADVVDVVAGLSSTTIGRPYTGGSYSIAKNGRFVFTSGTALQPADLSAGHFPTRRAITQITNLNENFFKKIKTGNVEEIWYTSSFDGWDIHGWIITPPDFDSNKKYPLILEIHGGPYASYGPQFTPELQLMASQGYVVLYTNPRGSTSYGTEFAAYINHNYPSEDHDDLMSGIDYMLEQGYIDENRLYITGGSGGGVLSSWAIGKTDRFAAAVVSKPVINWYSFALTSDAYPFFTKYWFKEMPWENPEQYLKFSPISLVGNVTTPTMLLTGEEDYRTPMSES